MLGELSLALNIWSLNDHFRQCGLNKQLDTSWQDKLMKICLDITSNVSFLIGEITSILPLEFPIIPFICIAFFILGCAFMATNFIRTMISQPQTDETKTSKLVNIQSAIAPCIITC
ncbi:hypothetical protein wTpre_1099 [Wolbachia endosymbiont of Trichogramma pretiosum]|nr:hypothetical protein wTpre_1099 [Wolbachia endosymbiont of Trichogramma pretiosum]